MAKKDDDHAIPKGRVRRSAKLGTLAGTEGARYAATVAGNVARRKQTRTDRLTDRHMEAAERLADILGEMKGAAMKMGQLGSFIDIDFLPEDYRALYQEKLAFLRTSAPAMPWKKIVKVLEDQYEGELGELFADFEHEAFAAASIGQVHRATLPDGRRVAVKIQYPGVEAALRADLSNAGMLMKLGKAIAPNLDARAIADELKERVMEELDYELEAQNQRSFARAYRGHPFIYVPDVFSRLSRRHVLVTECVEGMGFEETKQLDEENRNRLGEVIFRFYFGSIHWLQHFNADAHPGNYLLLDDGRVAFLDFGMTKQIDQDQIELEKRAVEAAALDDPERLRAALHDLGFVNNPQRIDAERLLAQTMETSGWYLIDDEVLIDAEVVMNSIAASSDPRSGYFDLMRRENMPANELMGARMQTGVLAVLGQLRAKRNWYRILREWLFGDPPVTELGELERDFFGARGR